MPTLCHSEESRVVREFLAMLGDKWNVVVLVLLSRTPQHRARFSELQRMVDGISQRMLTTTLRDLERDGLVRREVFAEVPPRVEYELAPLGLGLLEPMEQLVRWIGANGPAIEAARSAFAAQREQRAAAEH